MTIQRNLHFQGFPSEAKRKEPIGAAMAAFSVGNSWAFACRNQLRVKGMALRKEDTPLKEQDRHLNVEGNRYLKKC